MNKFLALFLMSVMSAQFLEADSCFMRRARNIVGGAAVLGGAFAVRRSTLMPSVRSAMGGVYTTVVEPVARVAATNVVRVVRENPSAVMGWTFAAACAVSACRFYRQRDRLQWELREEQQRLSNMTGRVQQCAFGQQQVPNLQQQGIEQAFDRLGRHAQIAGGVDNSLAPRGNDIMGAIQQGQTATLYIPVTVSSGAQDEQFRLAFSPARSADSLLRQHPRQGRDEEEPQQPAAVAGVVHHVPNHPVPAAQGAIARVGTELVFQVASVMSMMLPF